MGREVEPGRRKEAVPVTNLVVGDVTHGHENQQFEGRWLLLLAAKVEIRGRQAMLLNPRSVHIFSVAGKAEYIPRLTPQKVAARQQSFRSRTAR
jgi:hypothetical protein